MLRNNPIQTNTAAAVEESDGALFTENEDNVDNEPVVNLANNKMLENFGESKPHPIHTIHQLAPIMGITLLLTSLLVEKPFPGIFSSSIFRLDTSNGGVGTGVCSKILNSQIVNKKTAKPGKINKTIPLTMDRTVVSVPTPPLLVSSLTQFIQSTS